MASSSQRSQPSPLPAGDHPGLAVSRGFQPSSDGRPFSSYFLPQDQNSHNEYIKFIMYVELNRASSDRSFEDTNRQHTYVCKHVVVSKHHPGCLSRLGPLPTLNPRGLCMPSLCCSAPSLPPLAGVARIRRVVSSRVSDFRPRRSAYDDANGAGRQHPCRGRKVNELTRVT